MLVFHLAVPPSFPESKVGDIDLRYRFINLCSGDAIFAAEDPRSEDFLPIHDSMWNKNVGCWLRKGIF
jgi:hypothetical protein